MNLNKRIDPTALGDVLTAFNATELMGMRDIYENQNAVYEGSNLDEDAEWELASPLCRKLAHVTQNIIKTHINVLYCGQCGRLYAPTKDYPASDGIPWSEPCGECGAEDKTRAWVLPECVSDVHGCEVKRLDIGN